VSNRSQPGSTSGRGVDEVLEGASHWLLEEAPEAASGFVLERLGSGNDL
jgi:hypothetical protein